MDSVLIISNSEKDISLFMELLYQNSYEEIFALRNCGEARRLLMEREFDLCIINTPFSDEFGDELALDVASTSGSQVLLLVKGESYDAVASKVEQAGVFTIAKPMDKQVFSNALKLAAAAYYKLSTLKSENLRLLEKIEDFRIIGRAKCVLIQYLNMTEPEAHKYIERQAMDMRLAKRTVAERILKTYEM
jgi:AmiR/NasT family two-component response regulator